MVRTREKLTNAGAVNEHAARELYLYATNDSDLYRQQITPINKNLITKKARGVYKTALAVKLAMYLMDNAAKKYAREFGGGNWHDQFNVPTRREAAKEFVEDFENEADYGNYDSLLPAKYQKKNGAAKARGAGSQRNATAADFKQHQKIRLQELAAMFQGEASGEKRRVAESDYTPRQKYRLGYLKLLKIKPPSGRVITVNVDGDERNVQAFVAADLRNNLLIVGKDARFTDVKLPPKGQLKYIGKLIQIDYVTAKKHIGGGKLIHFYHKLGEVTGEHPNLFIDHDGCLIIQAGGYDVWDVGIVN